HDGHRDDGRAGGGGHGRVGDAAGRVGARVDDRDGVRDQRRVAGSGGGGEGMAGGVRRGRGGGRPGCGLERPAVGAGGGGVGGRLTGVMSMVSVTGVVWGPPLPVWPWSLVLITMTPAPGPLRSAAGAKVRPSRAACSADRGPVAVIAALPLPLTVRPVVPIV